VNLHPPEYWAELFARHGFYRDVDYDASYITPWAARFRKRQEPVHRVVRDYERRYWALLAETTDARAYATDVQKRLAEAERQRDGLRQELHDTAGERHDTAGELHRVNEQLRDTTLRLNQAVDRITHMERSVFWKLRLLWMRVRGLFS
jgi:chromosome segregation ATPase